MLMINKCACLFILGKMYLFGPLVVILTQNKLSRPNYVDWKRN